MLGWSEWLFNPVQVILIQLCQIRCQMYGIIKITQLID
ncbi:Uncharacterised protein [Vibrio cholerae]|nr:Uncharacterised protein [Vibrio cholerae]